MLLLSSYYTVLYPSSVKITTVHTEGRHLDNNRLVVASWQPTRCRELKQ